MFHSFATIAVHQGFPMLGLQTLVSTEKPGEIVVNQDLLSRKNVHEYASTVVVISRGFYVSKVFSSIFTLS